MAGGVHTTFPVWWRTAFVIVVTTYSPSALQKKTFHRFYLVFEIFSRNFLIKNRPGLSAKYFDDALELLLYYLDKFFYIL